MIIEVTESVYKGILIELVKGKGWKCNLGGTEYLFPYYTAAEAAIDEIFADITPIVTKRKATKLKKLPKSETNGYIQSKQFEAMFSELMQGEYEHLQLVLELLRQQKAALQSKNIAEVKRINKVLIEDTEVNLDNFVDGIE